MKRSGMLLPFMITLLCTMMYGVFALHTELVLDGPPAGPYSAQCGQYVYFKVEMIYPCKDLNISVTPLSGQPDVYVTKGVSDSYMYPTKYDLAWAAFQDDQYDVLISHWSPDSSPGYYYIGVYDDCSKQADSARFYISATTQFDDSDDILVHPELAMNKIVEAKGYTSFRFCVPDCVDIKMHMDNCQGPRLDCPGGNSSYAEFLTSRTELKPSLHGYTYKSATGRRDYFINASDPLARDNNGYFTGSYYVSAYGYCVDDEFLGGDQDSGFSCHYATIPFNITATTYPVGDHSKCTAPIIVPSTADYPEITPGVTYNGFVDVSEDIITPKFYYKLAVPEPCVDINFYMLTLTDPLASAAEFSIGKYPNTAPRFDNLQWTSYENKIQNFTISAYDPAFDGGIDCGPYKNETCYLYVGILGYSFTPGVTSISYNLKVTFIPADGLYNLPVATSDTIGHNAIKSYQFCVNTLRDTYVTLDSNRDPCNCPYEHTNLQMYVSKSNPESKVTGHVFRLDDSPQKHSIPLLASDPNIRAGTYYLHVYGQCDEVCDDPCTCSSCDVLDHTSYSVSVLPERQTSGFQTCPLASYGRGACSNYCPATTTASKPTIREITLDAARTGPYTVQCGQYAYFKVNMKYPCRDLKIAVDPLAGQPDVYVSKAVNEDYMYPTKYDLTWAAFQDDQYDVLISHWSPDSSPGYYFIGVYDDCSKQGDAAKFYIQATSIIDDSDDILVHPELAMNKIVPAKGYTSFRFCVSECADIQMHMDNCQGNRLLCPGGNSSYADFFTSRTELKPSLNGYNYKSATGRRSYNISASDPLARDNNGFFTGSYYVSAYGYCVDDEFVFDQNDGTSCHFATIPFNITVTLFPVADSGVCTVPITVPSTADYPILTPGITYNGFVDVDPAGVTPSFYYKLPVPEPCVDINFYMLTLTDPEVSAAEFSIGKYPNVAPNFFGLQWTSYQNKVQNFTISSYDPAFDGGLDCGPNKDETCYLYVGILGYSYSYTQLQYQLKVTFTPATGLYDLPVATSDMIGHNAVKSYQFCVNKLIDTYVTLDSNRDACNCPYEHTNLQMYVSKSNPESLLTGHVYRLDDNPQRHSIPLLAIDPNIRAGTYYLHVYGQCDEVCNDPCTCPRCSVLDHTSYSLTVLPQRQTSGFQTCPASAVKKGSCKNYCINPASKSAETISKGAQAGVAFAAIFVLVGLGVLIYFALFAQASALAPPRASFYKDTDHIMPVGSI